MIPILQRPQPYVAPTLPARSMAGTPIFLPGQWLSSSGAMQGGAAIRTMAGAPVLKAGQWLESSGTMANTPAAGIQLRGSPVAADVSADTITVNFDAAWAAGDVAYVAVMHESAGNTISEAGAIWTLRASHTVAGFSEAVFRKVLTAGDISTGSVTFNGFASADVLARGVAYSGGDQTTPGTATVTDNTANDADPTALDIGAVDAGDLAIAFVFSEETGLAEVTAGWISHGIGTHSTGVPRIGIVSKKPGAAAPGNFAWSHTSGRWAAYMDGLNVTA